MSSNLRLTLDDVQGCHQVASPSLGWHQWARRSDQLTCAAGHLAQTGLSVSCPEVLRILKVLKADTYVCVFWGNICADTWSQEYVFTFTADSLTAWKWGYLWIFTADPSTLWNRAYCTFVLWLLIPEIWSEKKTFTAVTLAWSVLFFWQYVYMKCRVLMYFCCCSFSMNLSVLMYFFLQILLYEVQNTCVLLLLILYYDEPQNACLLLFMLCYELLKGLNTSSFIHFYRCFVSPSLSESHSRFLRLCRCNPVTFWEVLNHPGNKWMCQTGNRIR